MGPVDAAALATTATVQRIEQLGAASFLYCVLPDGQRLTVHAPGQVGIAAGAKVDVHLPVADSHLFDAHEGERALARA